MDGSAGSTGPSPPPRPPACRPKHPLPACLCSSACPALQYKTYKLVYRRYAGLYFVFCVDASDNELLYLETIHLFVEVGASCSLLLTRWLAPCWSAAPGFQPVCGGGCQLAAAAAAAC